MKVQTLSVHLPPLPPQQLPGEVQGSVPLTAPSWIWSVTFTAVAFTIYVAMLALLHLSKPLAVLSSAVPLGQKFVLAASHELVELPPSAPLQQSQLSADPLHPVTLNWTLVLSALRLHVMHDGELVKFAQEKSAEQEPPCSAEGTTR
jgi:hypothetical protein